MLPLLAFAVLGQQKLKSIFTTLPVNPDPNAQAVPIPETKAEKAKRMNWWADARFGLFLHWGTYAVPAGTWDGKTNYAEWIRENAQIPINTYNKFATEFDPTQFNADAWVKMAKDAGMKYIVITSKHHEGFNMFASDYSRYNIMNTPWHHDPMKDLAAACKKYGLKFCFYYSIMDWHDEDYLPRRSWEVKDRPNGNANFQHYAQYLFHEIDQLLTQYGPIGVLWFDGEWESTWQEPYGTELYNLCRTLQPNIIVNNRVGHARNGELGDYFTPEQTIPATGIPGYWETCMTMNDHWGYNSHDHDFKSVKTLIRNLVDIASKGGNYLLNIGPTAQGTFPPQAVQTLKGIGDWMHINHDAIYSTSHSLYSDLSWGRNTVRNGNHGDQMYYEVFDWPADGRLVIPNTAAKVERARLLGTSGDLKVSQEGSDLVVQVPANEPDSVCPVVEVDTIGHAVVFNPPSLTTETPEFLNSATVAIDHGPGTAVHYTLDGSDPTSSSPLYSQPLTITDSCMVKAAEFYNGKAVTDATSLTLTKVSPLPPLVGGGGQDGLEVSQTNGDFQSVADVLAGTVTATVVEPTVELDPSWGSHIPEHVGRIFNGDILIPATDLYRFELTSDDGSALWIDGKQVVNNDGPHGAKAVTGNIALAAGMHRIRVVYFNATGDAALQLRWATGSNAFAAIPDSAYHHGPAGLPPSGN